MRSASPVRWASGAAADDLPPAAAGAVRLGGAGGAVKVQSCPRRKIEGRASDSVAAVKVWPVPAAAIRSIAFLYMMYTLYRVYSVRLFARCRA